jgi:hypothetical protein
MKNLSPALNPKVTTQVTKDKFIGCQNIYRKGKASQYCEFN